MSSFCVVVLTLVVSFVALINAGAVKFTDCGNGSLLKLIVTPCRSEPCVFKHGSDVQIQAVIRAPVGAFSATTSITGNLRGREMVFPKDNENICSGKIRPACPIKPGNVYTYATTFHIHKMIPAQPMEVTYKGLNERGETLACARLKVQITKT